MYFSIFANKGDGIPPHPTSDHLLGGSLHLAPYLLLDSLFTYFFGLRNEKKKKMEPICLQCFTRNLVNMVS